MDKYHLWLNSLAKEGNYPWLLEENNAVHLFKLCKSYLLKNNYCNEVTYHVWVDDNWAYAGRDYNEAFMIYKNNITSCEVLK